MADKQRFPKGRNVGLARARNIGSFSNQEEFDADRVEAESRDPEADRIALADFEEGCTAIGQRPLTV